MPITFLPDPNPADPVQVEMAEGPVEGSPPFLAGEEIGGLEFKTDNILYPTLLGVGLEFEGSKGWFGTYLNGWFGQEGYF